MNSLILLFVGVFATICISFTGFVTKSYKDFGTLTVEQNDDGSKFPPARAGVAVRGQDVYRAQGCAACHTMQARDRNDQVADFQRGFGKRQTVMRDFLYDQQVFLGNVRIGPDLANVGVRQADREWHLNHLYNPKTTVPKSLMPKYPFLFEQRRLKGAGSPEALKLAGEFAAPAGYEIVPTREAEELVAYLLSLKAEYRLFEAPFPIEKKVEVSGDQPDSAATVGAKP